MNERNNHSLVVFVILNVNQKEHTLRCLNSIYLIDYSPFEVVVVDNGSTDGSPEAICAAFPNVHMVRNSKNMGCAGGRNAGISYTNKNLKYEYILFQDNDTTADKRFINELINGLKSDSMAGIANPKVYFMSKPGVIQYAANSKMNFYTGVCSCKASGKMDRGQYDRAMYSDLAIGTCMLVKKEVMVKLQKFDEMFDPYGMEDRDFSLRASKEGYKILYVPSAVIHHKDSKTPSGGKYDKIYTKLKGRNLKILMKRHATSIQWLCFFGIAPLIGMRSIIREARKNNAKAAFTLIKSFFDNR